MRNLPDVSGSTRAYPEPLPNEAEQAHLAAARAWQKRVNPWNGLVFFSGIVCVIISVVWGNGRSSAASDPSLWESAPLAAKVLLFGGFLLFAVGTVAIVLLARRKGRHTKLLESCGIRLDPTKIQKVA